MAYTIEVITDSFRSGYSDPQMHYNFTMVKKIACIEQLTRHAMIIGEEPLLYRCQTLRSLARHAVSAKRQNDASHMSWGSKIVIFEIMQTVLDQWV